MGRTLPSITQQFLQEQESFNRFRRALRRRDQYALDALFAQARKHIAAAGYAAHALPIEVMLLAMLLEHEKRLDDLFPAGSSPGDPGEEDGAAADADEPPPDDPPA
jgi:hypothetical protein